ncbi:MAG TPA: hypothetical protein VKU44_10115, partial [Terriglobia bacterium]|nr:hypothetical protein [Terriglobia bacterium]
MRAKVRATWPSFAALLAFTLAGAVIIDQPAPGAYSGSLPELVPAGPLLVLESRDFSSLVHNWNGSAERRRWLESSNYAVFSRSRLFLRLKDAQDEFAAAAGLPPDMSLVESVAGRDSALALYDIGKLEFLYLTRLPQASAVESALWRVRRNYETREVAGRSY